MSLLLTNNSTPVTLTSAGTVPIGSAVHGCGRCIQLNGNNIRLNGSGYFHFLATVNAAITGTDTVSVSLLQDGAVVNTISITPAAAAADVEYVIPWVFYKTCGCIPSNISLSISGAATINDVTVTVRKG